MCGEVEHRVGEPVLDISLSTTSSGSSSSGGSGISIIVTESPWSVIFLLLCWSVICWPTVGSISGEYGKCCSLSQIIVTVWGAVLCLLSQSALLPPLEIFHHNTSPW